MKRLVYWVLAIVSGRKDSRVMVTLNFQFTKHVSTFSCHLQLHMSFLTVVHLNFMLRYVIKRTIL